MNFLRISFGVLFCLSLLGLQAQDAPPENWFNLDKTQDNIQGVSTEKTYKELLKGKKSIPVIVAVIDGGVDYKHEDLKDVMWVNPKEIQGNGKDDDNNGYADDIYGWNFIGGKDGKNIHFDNLEVARLYGKERYKYENADPKKLSKSQKKEYDKFLEMKKLIDKETAKLKTNAERYATLYQTFKNTTDAVKMGLKKSEVTAEDVKNFQTTDEKLKKDLAQVSMMMSQGSSLEDIKEGMDFFKARLEHHYNPDYNPRGIVGDNYEDATEKNYGNSDVKGPDALHGTHVAGIVAATRTNNLGMKGVADNVKIMAIRVVPDGDERDKDVANGIRYAVDNGAKVINMSFGKSFSYNKKVVDDAVKYAEKHDVLLVHAAGNDGNNTDKEANFPSKYYEKHGVAKNWIEVGALNWKGGEKSAASFSNYGKKNVDLFAPGTMIYSTAPENTYKNLQGTSMASPVVAGVAAVIRSYFPELSARQVREVLVSSTTPLDLKVTKPGSQELVPFSDLSATGGVVNLYNAVKKAQATKGKRKLSKEEKEIIMP